MTICYYNDIGVAIVRNVAETFGDEPWLADAYWIIPGTHPDDPTFS